MTGTRPKLAIAMIFVGLVAAACSGGSNGSGKPAARSHPAPFPAGTRPASAARASEMYQAYVATGPGATWYAGGGFEAKNLNELELETFVYASSARAARRYCTPLASAAAFFMQGHRYTLKLTGRTHLTSGVVGDAKFAPFTCPAYTGAITDPIPASVPGTFAAAEQHLTKFLNEYLGTFGNRGPDAWLFTADASAGVATLGVTDATPAKGLLRCKTLRPLARWLLGHFAKQETIRVAGSGNATWDAVTCP
jgi:hypothetical protein